MMSFIREELLFDIESYAFVEADITDDEHKKHQVFDIAQDGNEVLATRMMNLAHAECREMLYPFTKTPCEERVHTDALVRPDRYYIVMELPESFSETTVKLLKELIHDYFLCRVLGEWCGVTKPGSREYWEDRLQRIRDKIKSALSWRSKRVRLKLSPGW